MSTGECARFEPSSATWINLLNLGSSNFPDERRHMTNAKSLDLELGRYRRRYEALLLPLGQLGSCAMMMPRCVADAEVP